MLSGHLASAIQNFVQLQLTITKLQDIKVQKTDKKLHTNMEGFRRASHIYERISVLVSCTVYVRIYVWMGWVFNSVFFFSEEGQDGSRDIVDFT